MTTIDTLRFATAGSVDDGKSTLVGRLLHDSKSILSDPDAPSLLADALHQAGCAGVAFPPPGNPGQAA